MNVAMWYEVSIAKSTIKALKDELEDEGYKVMTYSSSEEAKKMLPKYRQIDDTIVVLDGKEGATPLVIEKMYKFYERGIFPVIIFVGVESVEEGELFKKVLRENITSKDLYSGILDWRTVYAGKNGVSYDPKIEAKDIKPLLKDLAG